MLAIELVADVIPPVDTFDTIQKVVDRMNEFRIRHLPVVSEQNFVGLICEDDLIEEPDYQQPVSSLQLSLVNPYVLEDQHVYDVVRLAYEQKLTVVPVLDAKHSYLGLITAESLVEHFATLAGIAQPGGIIVLEIDTKNNSLAHMAQIVESDNAQVLSSYIRTFPDSTRMEVTLKVNKGDISNILSTFLRYEYTIKGTFNHSNDSDNSRERYDSLMNYLNL
jgi:predicted transcriptional regulator